MLWIDQKVEMFLFLLMITLALSYLGFLRTTIARVSIDSVVMQVMFQMFDSL